MKRCFKCKVEKPTSEFYKHKAMSDGHLNKCKSCTKSDVSNNRIKNIDYYRKYDNFRYTVNGVRSEQRAEYLRLYRKENKEAYLAHTMVSNAVRSGKLKKPCDCSSCGKFTPSRALHAHHHDYSMPLDVEWLCASCHAERHPRRMYYS